MSAGPGGHHDIQVIQRMGAVIAEGVKDLVGGKLEPAGRAEGAIGRGLEDQEMPRPPGVARDGEEILAADADAQGKGLPEGSIR